MKEVAVLDVDSNNFDIHNTEIPEGNNALSINLTHWEGGSLDVDMEVSYDGGASWSYGGGAKGAISAERGISFHFTYQLPVTNVRGSFRSDRNVSSTMTLLAG